MTHDELVIRAAAWLRNSACVASKWGARRVRCRIVLMEHVSSISEIPDALGWVSCGMESILIECKANRSDFLRDNRKHFRRHAEKGIGTHRYYLVNPDVAKVEELPPTWGLLEPRGRTVKAIRLADRQERNIHAEIRLLYSAYLKAKNICGTKCRTGRQSHDRLPP